MYDDIIQLLDQHRLSEAFTQLEAFITFVGGTHLRSGLEQLQSVYGYMLHYAAEGTNDPGRDKMYAELYRTAYELADQAQMWQMKKGSGEFGRKFNEQHDEVSSSYESLVTDIALMGERIEEMPEGSAEDEIERLSDGLYNRHMQKLDVLFEKIWTSLLWTEGEQQLFERTLQPGFMRVNDLAVVTSAVTLSLLRLFDARKYRFLLELYQRCPAMVVTQRALVGIVLVAYYKEQRLRLYPDLTSVLRLWEDDATCLRQIFDVQRLLLLARETEKIDRKLRDEIIPQMMQNRQLMNPDMKILDIEDLEDQNPEWEANIAKITDELRAMGELQMEGADTYMSAFAQLKSFPFFGKMAHWFYPFDRRVAGIGGGYVESGKKTFIDMLIDTPIFCNSDKYSLCLSIESLPSSKRSLLTMEAGVQEELLRESMEQLNPQVKDSEMAVNLCRQYLHDLYRFYKLWPYRSEEHDVFADKPALWKCSLLRPLLFQMDHERRLADQLFAKEYFEEVIEIYQDLQRQPGYASVPEIGQKLGYAYQKLNNYPEAVKNYQKADVVKPDHVWTLKHLAQCYKRMHDYERALHYFYRVSEALPDNLQVILQIGQCLATLRRYDEALAYFFKVEYLGKASENAQRAIAWCYFMTGKYEEALRFYNKLLQSNARILSSDYLNMGHIYVVQDDIPDALKYYREARKGYATHGDFIRMYNSDTEILKEHGVAQEMIYLIPDMV